MKTQIQKEDSHAKMEAEIGVVLLQAKECLGLPDREEEARKDPPLEGSEGMCPC